MGIHDHPELKLGLLPHDKADDELLSVRWKDGSPPQVPAAMDNLAGVDLGLDGNDRFGDCGPTSVDNHRRLTTRALTGVEADATLDAVFDLYRRSGNPGFDPTSGADDNGVSMPVLMGAARSGGLGGTKLVAYGRLHDTSDASLAAAIALFGGVLFAVDLQEAQQEQSYEGGTWDYSKSADWGGHAIVAGAYDSETKIFDVGSWAMRIHTTESFRAHQLGEAWVPIWTETIGDHRFQANVDVAALAEQFKALTGADLPVPVAPPAPVPTPPPAPAPTPAPEVGLVLNLRDASVIERVQANATRHGETPDAYVERHLHQYFHLVDERQLGDF